MHKQLIDWIVKYIESRDAFSKSLLSTEVKNDRILFTFKDKKQLYLIMPELKGSLFNELSDQKVITCVALNTEENFDFTVQNWKKLLIKNFSLLFVDLEYNSKWVLSPYFHNKIADQESLEAGLRALADAARGKVFVL